MTPICTFCYKTAATSSLDNIKDGNNQCNSTNILLDRFCTLLERFRCEQSTEKFTSTASNYKFSSALSCCQDCVAILETFCSEYHQLKCMELQLEWKLQRLVSIMKLAGRVPSRVVKLKEMFESLDSNAEDTHLQHNVEGQARHSTMAGFKKFRQGIIKICAGHPLKSQPRVWLKRADNFSNTPRLSDKLQGPQGGRACSGIFGTSHIVNEHTTCDANSISLPISDVALGWVMSFAAVVILLTFGGRQGSSIRNEIPPNCAWILNGSDDLDQLDSLDDFEFDFREEDWVENISVAGPESCDNLENSNRLPGSPTVMKVVAADNLLEETDTTNSRTGIDPDRSIHVKDSAGEESSSNPVESLTENSECNDVEGTDSFEMETKTDEQKEKEEVISDIKCERTLISKNEPPSRNYNLREKRKQVFIKLEEDQDLEENVVSDDDASYNSSTSSDSSMSHGEYEKASRKMKKIASPDCNSSNAKQFKPRKCLARATPCKMCGKTFAAGRIMNIHIRRAHGTPALCKICNKMFGSEEWLKQHHSRVHVQRTHHCSECDKSFKIKDQLTRHLKIHLAPDAWDFKCSICGKKFYAEYYLNKHLITHNKDKNIFRCQFCSMTFPQNSELASHVRLDHIDKGDVGNKQIAQCSQCGKKFIGKNRLNMHMKAVHGEPAFSCSECGKSFTRKYEWKRHALIHKGPSAWKFQCSTCGYMCYTKSKLNLHALTHNKPEIFNCQFCGFTCQNAQLLSVHVRTEHIDKDDVGDVNLIKCSECDKKFIQERLLKRHMRHVHAEPSHQCSECGKVFKRKSKLDVHLRTHKESGPGKFRCTKCDYTCYDKYKLKLHMIAHEKGKRLDCPLCSSHFISGQALTVHIRSEHIDKGDVGDHTVFRCSKCDSKYIHEKSLQDHMTKSHPARLHKCTECDKSFRTSHTLKIHSAIHNDPSTWSFPCSECGKRFHQKGAMERHVRLLHKTINTLGQKEST